MAICPQCKEEISSLKNSCQQYCYYDFYIGEGGHGSHQTLDVGETVAGSNVYSCPECSEDLFYNEEEARDFLKELKGETNPNSSIRVV